MDPGSSASPLLTVGSSARVQGRSAAARPRYTLTGGAGAPRAPGGQEGHRGPLGPTCSGRGPDARRARQARASGACVHSCTWLTARTGALSRRVRGCWRGARTQASLAAPAGRGTSFPTQEGRQGAAPTWAVLGEAEPGGVAPAAGVRAWPKAGRDYERWRAVAGGGPAMSLVLLSLAALCCGAMLPEPVSPYPRPLPLSPPAFPSLEPVPKFVPPVSSCFSKAFAEGRL